MKIAGGRRPPRTLKIGENSLLTSHHSPVKLLQNIRQQKNSIPTIFIPLSLFEILKSYINVFKSRFNILGMTWIGNPVTKKDATTELEIRLEKLKITLTYIKYRTSKQRIGVWWIQRRNKFCESLFSYTNQSCKTYIFILQIGLPSLSILIFFMFNRKKPAFGEHEFYFKRRFSF